MNGFRSQNRSRKISIENKFDKYTNHFAENNRKDVITEYNDRKYFLKKNNFENRKIISNKKIVYNELINYDLNKEYIKVKFIYKAIYSCF
jgi:hypothetical protein